MNKNQSLPTHKKQVSWNHAQWINRSLWLLPSESFFTGPSNYHEVCCVANEKKEMSK